MGKSKTNPIGKPQRLNPEIWGPHYWFVLHTMAYSYPEYPTNVTKKKYYDFISNLPLFLPDPKMGDKFAEFLDRYPISPFLDSRESFMRWVHFIHNKMNVHLGKEEISIYKALDQYHRAFLPKPVANATGVMHESWRTGVFLGFLIAFLVFIYMTASTR